MRSAADMAEVGCPEPAIAARRTASTRSWRASACQVAGLAGSGRVAVSSMARTLGPPVRLSH